jgi:hypothetical protein
LSSSALQARERLEELIADISGDVTAILPDAYRRTRVTYLTAPPRVSNYLETPEALRALRDTLFATCVHLYRTTIADKVALIVVDDVWSKSDVEPVLAEFSRSRFLFTTRDAAIGRLLGAHEHLAKLLDVVRSRELLAAWAGVPVANLPAEAEELISECRRLPLAVELRHMGYRVFLDAQSIKPGDKWKRRLEHAIRRSRTLVLCWSERARGSDYVTFEYSRAEALHKLVFPWRLDSIPLPAMLEIQGVSERDPVKVALALRPMLGWTLTRRRAVQAVIALLLAVAVFAGTWRYFHPPPWVFQGDVIDRDSQLPVSGVEVDVRTERATFAAFTDKRGHYELSIPEPQPQDVELLFRKEGYEPENPTPVSTSRPFPTDIKKLAATEHVSK